MEQRQRAKARHKAHENVRTGNADPSLVRDDTGHVVKVTGCDCPACQRVEMYRQAMAAYYQRNPGASLDDFTTDCPVDWADAQEAERQF